MHSHSQRLSPSSSAGSSRSGSPDTRATTPSLHSDSEHTPASHVYLFGALPDAEGMKAIWAKHASSDRLGVIIEDGDQPTFLDSASKDEWSKQTLSGGGEYHISATYQPAISSATEVLICTDPVQASHQLLFSLSSLRSIISQPLSPASPTSKGSVTLHILEKPFFVYPPLSHTTAHSLAPSPDGKAGNIPTLEEWKTLWANWDLITMEMIPREMLHQKPIDLRHKCLFYIGHIPTFLDMLLCKAIGGEPTEPKYFWNIFERGIDPHVDDPDHCHSHSVVPDNDDDWPTLASIIAFRTGVRARLERLYDDLASGKQKLTRNVARTLVMTHEHEGFHIETLLYMLIQRSGSSPGTLPPPGFIPPPFSALSQQWASIPPPSTSYAVLGPALVTLGHDDSEGEDKLPEYELDVQGRTFGWDNESPRREVTVGRVRVAWRPVTNGEFEVFWREGGMGKDEGKVGTPKSWVVDEEGNVKVRTLYGPIPLSIARDWPVLTSYDDLVAYAASKGGRLPTEPELRLFLDLYDVGHEGGANVGFRSWHPVPATTGLDVYEGKGSNGGVWEWTSTVFDTHEGLVPTQLFTGYSTDFFDTKHQVALGASYATVPRLAGRRTVRNFYQHNYPYPWIGARVVWDA